MVKAEELNPDALLAGLKAGTYYSSQGPLLHDVRVEDKKVRVACSPADRIIVVGAGASAKQLYGKGMVTGEIPTAAFRDGGWLRVIVADRFDRKAWSNPIWLD